MRRLWLLACFVALTVEAQPVSLSLDEVPLADLVKLVYTEVVPRPFVLSTAVLQARRPVSLSLRGEKPEVLIAQLTRLLNDNGFTVQDVAGVAWIGATKPAEDEILVYRPRHRSARYLADVVQSVTAARVIGAAREENSKDGAPAVADKQPQGRDVASVAGMQARRQQIKPAKVAGVDAEPDALEVDQIAFSVALADVAKVNKLLKDLDTASGEVLLKAAVYEVGFDKREGSAVQIAASLMSGKLSGTVAGNILGGVSLKLVQGGLAAVVSALDEDVRFKSVSRPQVRVRNGAQARFSVGQDVPVLGAAQMDKNGNPVQSVEYKQSGVILTATPEIRQDVIELQLQQELSNFVVTKTGVNGSPTLVKRSVNTKLGLVPGEVVILAGLQDDQEDASQNRMPFVGWLLGQERQQKQSEILVFIEVVRI